MVIVQGYQLNLYTPDLSHIWHLWYAFSAGQGPVPSVQPRLIATTLRRATRISRCDQCVAWAIHDSLGNSETSQVGTCRGCGRLNRGGPSRHKLARFSITTKSYPDTGSLGRACGQPYSCARPVICRWRDARYALIELPSSSPSSPSSSS